MTHVTAFAFCNFTALAAHLLRLKNDEIYMALFLLQAAFTNSM